VSTCEPGAFCCDNHCCPEGTTCCGNGCCDPNLCQTCVDGQCKPCGGDGQIQTTEKWQKQWSVIPDHTWYGSSRTVRVCLVADGRSVRPTDSQIKRAEALVETLSAKFSVPPAKIFYPSNWR